MPIVITPESDLGRELAKWEQPGYNPAAHPFPKMLYRANRRPDGVVSVGEADDAVFGGQPGAAEAFNSRCQIIVENEVAMSQAAERGWFVTPAEALAYSRACDKRLSTTAAHRAHEDRSMSAAARAEAAAVEAATPEHVAEIPEKPGRRRGQPKGSKNKRKG